MTNDPNTTFIFLNGRIVNRIGYGAMRLTGQPRNFGPYADWQGGIDLLRRARDLGINHIDTARAYGPHENEKLIADALVDADGSYGEMFIASKGGVEKSATSLARDTSAETMKRHLEESLASLRTDKIDLYYVHAPDGITSISESVAAFEEMRQAGKIDMIGLSNVTRAQVEEALKVAPVAAVQNRYSPADERDEELEEMIDWLNEQGIAFVPHGPLGADPMKQGATVDPGEALRTLLARAPNILVIPGTTTIAHLEDNASVLAT
ncbi:aldo/keto reductase [Litoreibacter roseus]|uniref:Aldo/keto reductase n=1 Tax=Litoreibacter roseus TaxID=2601869 RepID=A0A6N6JNL1_9RHOB|nr:aldo/keto reductase [Litoreibacter roseus]GFE66952.1 aldo/keto reductase [Litoreibacter roseus]